MVIVIALNKYKRKLISMYIFSDSLLVHRYSLLLSFLKLKWSIIYLYIFSYNLF